MSVRILEGDARAMLAALPDASAQCCVTSPPYFGLRDYGHAGQIGLEPTPDEYVAQMVAVFRDVRRVLREDGTLWINLGDTYAGGGRGGNPTTSPWKGFVGNTAREAAVTKVAGEDRLWGMKPKDLLGIPWRVAFALQADGWWLRADIIWHKPNPMPESVTDRPTKAHEYVFLLTKAERYYYDAGAIAEPAMYAGTEQSFSTAYKNAGRGSGRPSSGNERPGAAPVLMGDTRNARTVWPIATQPYKGAHFATMPPALAERCIKAGTKRGDMVLDPFGGAGTTGLVADRLGRDATLIELNPTYAALARERIKGDNPMFTEVA